MDNIQKLDLQYRTVAWGLLFVWWGLRWWLFISLPNGSGLVGTGLILLGLNLARAISNMPSKGSTTLMGISALILGVLMIALGIYQIPLQIPIIETALILSGLALIGNQLLGARKPPASSQT
jgi:hypothetical protein